MPVDEEWARQNLGLDTSTPRAEVTPQGDPETGSDRGFQRDLIDFDSEGPTGKAFRAKAPLAALGLSHYIPILWPAGLVPKPGLAPKGESLPRADVLIVTWTVDEGHALSQVLSPGEDAKSNWKAY